MSERYRVGDRVEKIQSSADQLIVPGTSGTVTRVGTDILGFDGITVKWSGHRVELLYVDDPSSMYSFARNLVPIQMAENEWSTEFEIE